ncbi:MAG TPA: hypothetical protein PK360_17790, partial [bacterium]|nr:hypothetical protein [bacterium]
FHGTDLSNGSDTDTVLERALALQWNPGAGALVNTHIYISTDGVSYSFLGQTGAENINYFRFDANGTFALSPAWNAGPQDQTTYWFRIHAIWEAGGAEVLFTGPVQYGIE